MKSLIIISLFLLTITEACIMPHKKDEGFIMGYPIKVVLLTNLTGINESTITSYINSKDEVIAYDDVVICNRFNIINMSSGGKKTDLQAIVFMWDDDDEKELYGSVISGNMTLEKQIDIDVVLNSNKKGLLGKTCFTLLNIPVKNEHIMFKSNKNENPRYPYTKIIMNKCKREDNRYYIYSYSRDKNTVLKKEFHDLKCKNIKGVCKITDIKKTLFYGHYFGHFIDKDDQCVTV